MKYFKALFLSFFLVVGLNCSKSPNEEQEAKFNDKRVVLQVDDNKLTLGEVEKRYATTPFTDVQQEYDVKKGFVDDFLERFLLIKGAKEAGIEAELDTTVIRRVILKQLYNEEVLNKIKVDDQEIEKFFNNFGGELQTGRIQVSDSTLADSLYKALLAGAEFEKLAKEFSEDPISSNRGGSLGYAPYGRYEDRYQELAFGMKIGELSKPLHTRSGWHIIKLFDRIKNTPEDLAREKDKYRDLTHQYLQKMRVRKFIAQLRKDYDYKISQPVLNLLLAKADSIKALGGMPANLPSSAYLNPAAFDEAGRAMRLVEYDGGGVTVGEYLNLLRGYEPTRAPELRNAELLDEVMEGMASPGLLEKMARERGYDRNETYISEIEYLKGSMLMQKMRDKIYSGLRNIEEQDIVDYYNGHRDKFFTPDFIKTAAVAVKTKEEAESLLARIKGGANMAQIAKKYSLDRASAVRGGDLDYFSVARYTQIYNAAESLAIGNFGGPVEMDGNWWIFRLDERQARKPKELNQVRADISSLIGQEWRANAFNEWIAAIKERTPYKMDLDLIKNNLRMGTLPADEM